MADLERGVAGGARLGDGDVGEEEAQLRVQQRGVAAAENLGDEAAAGPQQARGDAERGEDELRLAELIEVVHARHVGRTVRHDQVRPRALKVREDRLGRGALRNVALQLQHAGQGGHGLQVHRHQAHLRLLCGGGCLVQAPGQHLSRGGGRRKREEKRKRKVEKGKGKRKRKRRRRKRRKRRRRRKEEGPATRSPAPRTGPRRAERRPAHRRLHQAAAI